MKHQTKKLPDNVKKAGIAVIVIDLLLPDPEDDDVWLEAIRDYEKAIRETEEDEPL